MTQMTAALSGPWVREPRRLHFPVEAEVPETKEDLELRTALYLIVKAAFADRAVLGSDQFVYWDPTDPAACVAPDVFVRLGGPDELFEVWKVWERGAPEVAVEIVSSSDTGDAPWSLKLERYRRLGVRELVRFDPADPERPLRVWDHVDGDLVERRLLRPTSAASDPSASSGWRASRMAAGGSGSRKTQRDRGCCPPPTRPLSSRGKPRRRHGHEPRKRDRTQRKRAWEQQKRERKLPERTFASRSSRPSSASDGRDDPGHDAHHRRGRSGAA